MYLEGTGGEDLADRRSGPGRSDVPWTLSSEDEPGASICEGGRGNGADEESIPGMLTAWHSPEDGTGAAAFLVMCDLQWGFCYTYEDETRIIKGTGQERRKAGSCETG